MEKKILYFIEGSKIESGEFLGFEEDISESSIFWNNRKIVKPTKETYSSIHDLLYFLKEDYFSRNL